jgi:glycerol uptake facilitator-like aquaporin
MTKRKFLAEFIGTSLLLAANVGSAAMAQSLTDISGVRILINCVATALALGLLIFIFSSYSGAHFNPAVSLVEFFGKRLKGSQLIGYLIAQFLGGILGVIIANLMYGSPALVTSTIERSGAGILLGEVIATGGLVFVINMLRIQKKSEMAPVLVASWIASAFLFTSSTAFANPAVTFARAWTDNISGIAPQSQFSLISAQLVGAGLAAVLVQQFKKSKKEKKND